jgi:uroporphyrinogen decarboxylase
MTGYERVRRTITGEHPDRIPIYGWLRSNLEQQLTETYGSVEAFEDQFEFDLAHIFGGPYTYPTDQLQAIREDQNGDVSPQALLDLTWNDPNEDAAYEEVRKKVSFYKHDRKRFVYMQTPGIFEALNGAFGIEKHLLYTAMYPDILHEVYARQAEWNKTFALNCLDIGLDMIHVSDDWGAQQSLLFNPQFWKSSIYPYHKFTCDAVKKAGGFLSLHSDGNVMSVLDGIVDLGYDVVHPFQESAGMDYQAYLQNYADRFSIMGGLDIQTTLGFGKLDFLTTEIDRILTLFSNKRLLLCTTHYVQAHCSIEELTVAYEHIRKRIPT